MTSTEIEDCPVLVSTLLSHGVSPWARTKEFVNPAGVDPGNCSETTSQGKK